MLVVIVAAVIALVGAPLLRHDAGPDGDRGEVLADLEARKEAKYREIRDAQSDLSAGKLSEEDHRALDLGLRREAVEILREIDRVSARREPSGGEGTGDGG